MKAVKFIALVVAVFFVWFMVCIGLYLAGYGVDLDEFCCGAEKRVDSRGKTGISSYYER